MHLKSYSLISFCVLLLFSCDNTDKPSLISYDGFLVKSANLTHRELKNWYRYDIEIDTIPGISLERAFNEILKNKEGEEIVVAIIDGKVDIEHSQIKSNLWKNDKDHHNNGIDDDKNGYIDDKNGWNFLGGVKNRNSIYVNYEVIRIIRYYKNQFDGFTIHEIDTAQIEKFKLYQNAIKNVDSLVKRANLTISLGEPLIENYRDALDSLAPYIEESDITLEKLDSILEKHSNLKVYIELASRVKKFNLTLDGLKDDVLRAENTIEIYLNPDFDGRRVTNDNPYDINDIGYGNNDIYSDHEQLYHGTLVAGMLLTNGDKEIGLQGGNQNIKIMPLCISSNGDEHDKDIALAIRYAVDNGAKIINMSISKEWTLFPNWVDDAIKYAEKKDVLIITSAGNNNFNLNFDSYPNYPNYPNDTDSNGNEFASNFIKVGGSDYYLNENIKYSSTNYGDFNVDLFAPGDHIFTTSPREDDGFETTNGTSFSAPLVAGIAALIWSHYPNLTAKDVKQIIMESGVEYDIMVNVPTPEDPDRQLPFNQLSKSGKIVNAYNALLMAADIAKAKK